MRPLRRCGRSVASEVEEGARKPDCKVPAGWSDASGGPRRSRGRRESNLLGGRVQIPHALVVLGSASRPRGHVGVRVLHVDPRHVEVGLGLGWIAASHTPGAWIPRSLVHGRDRLGSRPTTCDGEQRLGAARRCGDNGERLAEADSVVAVGRCTGNALALWERDGARFHDTRSGGRPNAPHCCRGSARAHGPAGRGDSGPSRAAMRLRESVGLRGEV